MKIKVIKGKIIKNKNGDIKNLLPRNPQIIMDLENVIFLKSKMENLKVLKKIKQQIN